MTITLVIAFVFAACPSFAQQSRIVNVRVNLSATTDSLIVLYDVVGDRMLDNVKLDVRTREGKEVEPRAVSGDLGSGISPGKDYTIVWNIAADSLNIAGKRLEVKVAGEFYLEPWEIQKKPLHKYFYISAGTAALGGVYSQYRVNRLYSDQYLPERTNEGAAHFNAKIRQWEGIRNVAYGAAGLLGSVGLVVHFTGKYKKQPLTIHYYPQPGGVQLGLSYNF